MITKTEIVESLKWCMIEWVRSFFPFYRRKRFGSAFQFVAKATPNISPKVSSLTSRKRLRPLYRASLQSIHSFETKLSANSTRYHIHIAIPSWSIVGVAQCYRNSWHYWQGTITCRGVSGIFHLEKKIYIYIVCNLKLYSCWKKTRNKRVNQNK